MTEAELKSRTKKFAVDIFKFIEELPTIKSTNIIANQLGRCASSIGANYRAACRARSHKEFISKIGIVEEESDESVFWIELLIETNKTINARAQVLLQEAKELTAIFTVTHKTAKRNAQASKL